MRRILSILFILASFTSVAQTVQTIGSPGTRVNSRGDFISDSILYLPRTQVTSRTPFQSGAIRYQASDSSIYQWTGTAWRKISGTVDSLLFSTRAWRQKGIDSINAVNASGTGISGYMTRWSGTKTMDTSQIFQQANRIGIGKTAPLKTLDVGGQLGVGMATNADNRGYDIEFSTNQQTGGIDFTTSSPNAFLDLYAGGSVANAGGWNGAIRFFTGGTNEYGTERMRLLSSGTLQMIGNSSLTTLSGSYKSIIVGNSNTTSGTKAGIQFNGVNNSGSAYPTAVIDVINTPGSTYAEGTLQFITTKSDGNFAEGFRLTSSQELLVGTTVDAGDFRVQVSGNQYVSGNVGIGTTSPTQVLHVSKAQNATTRILLENTDATNTSSRAAYISVASTVETVMQSIHSYGGLAGTLSNHNYELVTNGNTRMRINTDGEVLFGTTTDAGDFRVQVSGNFYVTNNVGIGQTTFGTSAAKVMAFNNGTAPSTSPADAFQLYSNDITAGNAAPHFRTENGAVIKIYQETTGVAGATRAAVAGNTVSDADTFDGYTVPQIVKALRNLGILQ